MSAGADRQSLTDSRLRQRIVELETENQRLGEREQLFRSLFEQAPVGICLVAPDGKPIHVNRVLQGMLGYSETELCRHYFTEWVHPDDVAQGRHRLDRLRKGRIDSFSTENRYCRADGSYFWAQTSLAALCDAPGYPACFIAVMEDIQGRKEMQADLKASEALLAQAQRLARIGHWRWDFHKDLPVWSPELYRLFGRDPSRPAANFREVSRYFATESWSRLASAVDGCLQHGIPYELDVEVVREDGGRRWVLARGEPVRDAAEDIVELRGMLQDITERKQGEKALAEQEARYRAVIETAEDGFWMLNREGRLLAVNDAYVRRSGYSREELLTLGVDDLQERETWAEIKGRLEALEHPRSHLFETRHRARDGRVWPVEINISFSPVSGGLFFAFMRDITERRSLERRIIEASTAEQERIGRDIHDGLGQQLTALSMLTRSIERRLAAGGEQETARDLAELGVHLQATLEEARAIARDLIPFEFDPEGLTDALLKLTERVGLSSGTACHFVQTGEVRVNDSAEAIQLYRIAQEALHNAVRHGQPQRVDVSLQGGPDGLTLSVRDNGIGIGSERNKGECLGLRIMRYRANTIGARLSIEHAVGGGTLVRCTVPVAEDW